MGTEQLISRYFQLKQELAVAYNTRPWQSARIDRLANQLSLMEKEIASLREELPTPPMARLRERLHLPTAEPG